MRFMPDAESMRIHFAVRTSPMQSFKKRAGLTRDRQSEGKDCAAAGFVARGDVSAVVLDDFLADGKPQAGALSFSMGGERLEHAPGHLRRDAGAGVLDLGDKLAG